MQTKITDAWIKKHNPCKEALDIWDKKERDSLKILEWLMEIKKDDWANWFIVRVMTYKQYVSYAVYAAEQVIDIYEKQYPTDKRPRAAIEAAKKCIVSPTKKNKAAAYAAAYATAYAADAAAADAAESAWSAAWSARSAAWSAAADAAWSARSAARSAAWSAAWSAWAAAWSAMKKKILGYGISLLRGA